MSLEIKDLHISYETQTSTVYALSGLNLTVNVGDAIGIVGESGSGKTQAMFGVMGLLPKNAKVSGQVLFHGQDLLKLPSKELNKIRGNKISIVFQDHMNSLNPYLTIETQMMEVLKHHKNMVGKAALHRSIELLELLRIPDASNKIRSYAHQFSGGMRQRIMIAMAILSEPEILIADEPTTALDVTIQAQIMALLKDIKKEFNTAVILITHDLGLVANFAEKVLVMYGGRSMEYGSVEEIYREPSHPYTIGLLKAIPRIDIVNKKLFGIPGSPRSKYQDNNCCPFHERCFAAVDLCHKSPPNLKFVSEKNQTHSRACFVPVAEVHANSKS